MRRSYESRLRKLEEQDPDERWQHTYGLSALLAYAKRHQPAPWDVDLDEVPTGSMGRLLAEARQYQNGVKKEPV